MDRVIVVEDHNGGPLTPWVHGADAVRPAATRDRPDIDLVCNELLERESTQNSKLIILCADWKPFPDASRFDQHGVTLLKHLRLGLSPNPTDDGIRRTHVVVCSWESAEELMRRKPGNTILLSDAVTFLRLPEGLNRLADVTFLEARAKVRATVSKKYLRTYVAADYQPPASMHEVSNWWGVYQIWRSRKRAELEQLASLRLPAAVEHEVRKLNNKEALVLFADEELPEVGHAERGAIYLGEGKFFAAHPKLVLIDDDANLGWADILRCVMDFVPASEIHNYVRVPKVPSHLDETWVRHNVIGADPDIVLLDLRLRGNQEINTPADETSGATVLREIRKLDCGLPVILMTASNKYWTYREMLKLGADGYWMKEGLGEHRPPVSAAKHYSELLELIIRCTGPGYHDLKRLSRAFNALRNRPHVWWQRRKWPAPMVSTTLTPRQLSALQSTKVGRAKVETQFENTLSGFRSYVQAHLARTVFIGHRDVTAARGEELRALGLAGGKVIEEVHSFEHFFTVGLKANAAYIGGIDGESYRKDYVGMALYAFRNRCAHASVAPPTFEEVRDYLALLLAYLSIEPIDNYTARAGLANNVAENADLLAKYTELRGCEDIESRLRRMR